MGITNPLGQLKDFLTGMWNNIVSAVNAVYATVWDAVAGWGKWVKNELVSHINSVINLVQNSITYTRITIQNTVNSAALAVKNRIIWAKNAIVSSVNSARDWLNGKISAAKTAILKGITSATNTAIAWSKWVADHVTYVGNNVINTVNSAKTAVINSVTNTINNAGNVVISVVNGAKTAVQNTVTATSNVVLGAVGGVASLVRGVATGVTNLASTVQSFVKSLISVFTDILGVIWQGILTALQAIADFFVAITDISDDDIAEFMARVFRTMNEFSGKVAKEI